MLVMTVELLPGGYRPMARTFAMMRISNVSNLADISDYRVEVLESESGLAGLPPRSAVCRIVAHDRNQSVWALVAKAAQAALDARNEEARCRVGRVSFIEISARGQDPPREEGFRNRGVLASTFDHFSIQRPAGIATIHSP